MELSILHFKKCSTDYIDIFYSFLIMRAIHARVYKKRTWHQLITVLIISCTLYSSSVIHSNALAYTAAFILLAPGIDYDEIVRAFYKAAFFSSAIDSCNNNWSCQ